MSHDIDQHKYLRIYWSLVYNIRELSRRVINAALSNILISMRAKCEGTYRHLLSPPTGGAAHVHIGICLREQELRISSLYVKYRAILLLW